jgi:antitoxin PrlF
MSRLTSKGQVTIPKAVRDRLGLGPGDEIEFVETSGGFHIRKRPQENSFERWIGFLSNLENRDPVKLVREMRGE